MTGPGLNPEPKKIWLDSIGQVTAPPVQFEGNPRPLFNMKKRDGSEWTAFFVDPIGIQIVSHTTQNTFTIAAKTLIELALEAGIDEEKCVIVLPGEAARGA